MINDRCSRIAELLLIENEVLKLETACESIIITDGVNADLSVFDYLESKGKKVSPIEKIMYAILVRIKYRLCESYNGEIEIKIKQQVQIGKYSVDFLVTANLSDDKIIIECDGHDFHEKTKEQAKHDKERDRWLTSQGFKILRYTGSEIYNNFQGIEAELIRLLDVSNSASLFTEKK